MIKILTKHWIDTELSADERQKLIEEILKEVANPTAVKILKKIKELFPKKKHYPSLQSVCEWKARSWHLVFRINEKDSNKKIFSEIVLRKVESLSYSKKADKEELKIWLDYAAKLTL